MINPRWWQRNGRGGVQREPSEGWWWHCAAWGRTFRQVFLNIEYTLGEKMYIKADLIYEHRKLPRVSKRKLVLKHKKEKYKRENTVLRTPTFVIKFPKILSVYFIKLFVFKY